jgi:hypothetical protein
VGANWTTFTAKEHVQERYADYLADAVDLPFVLLHIISEYISDEFNHDNGLFFSIMLKALKKLTEYPWEMGKKANHFTALFSSSEALAGVVQKLKQSSVFKRGLDKKETKCERLIVGEFDEKNYPDFIKKINCVSLQNVIQILQHFSHISVKWFLDQPGYYHGVVYSYGHQGTFESNFELLSPVKKLLSEFFAENRELNLQVKHESVVSLEITVKPKQVQKLLTLISREEARNYLSRQRFNLYAQKQAQPSVPEKALEPQRGPG